MPVTSVKYDRNLVVKISPEIDQYIDRTADMNGCSRAAVVRSALLDQRRRSISQHQDGDRVNRKA